MHTERGEQRDATGVRVSAVDDVISGLRRFRFRRRNFRRRIMEHAQTRQRMRMEESFEGGGGQAETHRQVRKNTHAQLKEEGRIIILPWLLSGY